MKEIENIKEFIRFEVDPVLFLRLKRANKYNNFKEQEAVKEELLKEYNNYINESA